MIIIPTHISRVNTWLKDCLDSIQTKHKVMVVFQGEKPAKNLKIGFDYDFNPTGQFDPGGIVWAMENCKDEEFLLLHDSCVVKDNLIFDILFHGYRGESVALATVPVAMGMFMGKYRIDIAKKLDPPVANTKEESVDLEESWNKAYCELEYPVIIDSPLTQSDVFEEKHGRENMILENRWIKKYKGSWNRHMIQ